MPVIFHRIAAALVVLAACGGSGGGGGADAGPPEAADAGTAPDAGPLAHCVAEAPLPGWVETDAPHRFVARRDAVNLHIDALVDTPIYIATSTSGWLHEPLEWTTDGTARGEILVPRGQWFLYKYTRGDWDTVEKWPGCEEASDRYRFGAAVLFQTDTVFGWRDWCP